MLGDLGSAISTSELAENSPKLTGEALSAQQKRKAKDLYGGGWEMLQLFHTGRETEAQSASRWGEQ